MLTDGRYTPEYSASNHGLNGHQAKSLVPIVPRTVCSATKSRNSVRLQFRRPPLPALLKCTYVVLAWHVSSFRSELRSQSHHAAQHNTIAQVTYLRVNRVFRVLSLGLQSNREGS